MANKQLPKVIDPFRFSAAGQDLIGAIPLKGMHRLAEACQVTQLTGMVTVELKGTIEQKVPVITGKLTTKLPLVCQRCMKQYEFKADLTISLVPVHSEAEGKNIPADYEPLICTEEGVDLAQLIEEELLINLPIVSLHPYEECEIKQGSWQFGEQVSQSSKETKAKPFAKLASLKVKKR